MADVQNSKRRRGHEEGDEQHVMKKQWVELNVGIELYKNGEGTDFVIEVIQNDDQQEKSIQKEFNVHKFELMCTSEVFRAMFSHKNTKEWRESRITITDSTIAAVGQMIHYIYTGTVPDDYSSETDALPLMAIAHKYQFKPLMDFNEQKLIESLTMKNVLDRFILADMYERSSLKSTCGQIIQMNMKKLKLNDKWAEFEKKSPELALSLLDGQTEYFIMANKLCNPTGNFWNPTNTMAKISEEGLNANADGRRLYVFAMQPFEIPGECERDMSPCKVLYYYEVTNIQTWYLLVGLSNGNIQNNQLARKSPNFYGLWKENYCCLAGQQHNFEWPLGTIQPIRNGRRDVIGCGLLLLPENKLAIFFTLNGILMGSKFRSVLWRIVYFQPLKFMVPVTRILEMILQNNSNTM